LLFQAKLIRKEIFDLFPIVRTHKNINEGIKCEVKQKESVGNVKENSARSRVICSFHKLSDWYRYLVSVVIVSWIIREMLI
jgi:hypothetical protein